MYRTVIQTLNASTRRIVRNCWNFYTEPTDYYVTSLTDHYKAYISAVTRISWTL